MKRTLGLLIAVAALVFTLLPAPTAQAASTNNFTISSYDIQYDLSRDSEGRSVLKTKETITAQFPMSNQNHGLERAIPARYDTHSVDLSIDSIRDESGRSLSYSSTTQGDLKVLRIGDKDRYVHGANTYVIEYTQRDVTKYFSDTNRDEWYWDTNGTEWAVPITKLTATITLSSEVAGLQTVEPSCYFGYAGSSGTCVLTKQSDTVYTLEVTNVLARQNATVVFGFPQNTFAAHKVSFTEILMMLWPFALLIVTVPCVIIFIILMVVYSRRRNRTNEVHETPPQFIPPRDASVIVAGQVVSTITMYSFSAQLIDLAVRRYISIIETRAKSTWRPAEYDIQVLKDVMELHEEEREILSDMFGHSPVVGERLALKTLKNNMSYNARTLDNDKKLKVLIEGAYNVRQKQPSAGRLFVVWGIIFLVPGLLTLSPWIIMMGIVLIVLGKTIRPLTDKGLELRRYVLGLRRYIKASEAERLQFLQGPDTAEKVGEAIDVQNPGQVVKLYERALPYAVLFGYQKQWADRLGQFYQQTNSSPDWYTGTTAFNAAVFSSTLMSFSQASSYSSGASSSSSSGGSGGGGFSGGGGGGGGGGGW